MYKKSNICTERLYTCKLQTRKQDINLETYVTTHQQCT